MNQFVGTHPGPSTYPQQFAVGPSAILNTAAFDTSRLTYSGQPPQSQTNIEPTRFAGNSGTSLVDTLYRQIYQLQSQLASANQRNGWLEEQWRFKCEDYNRLTERLQIAEQRTAKDKEHLRSFNVQLEKASQRISSLEVDLDITKSTVAAEALSRAELQDRLSARTSELEKTNKSMHSTKDELAKTQRMLAEETVARLQAEAKLRNANERIKVLEAAANTPIREPDVVQSSNRTASPMPADRTPAVTFDNDGAFPYDNLMDVINSVKLEAPAEQHLDNEDETHTTLPFQNEASYISSNAIEL